MKFDTSDYKVKTQAFMGESVTYRAFEKISYLENPVDDIQVMNIYVPEDYYCGKKINGYCLKTAPIFLPNSVGGYMPGPAMRPECDHEGNPNSVVRALQHGYVVAAPGLRGRGMKKDHENIGMAPADICDYKAAVRYLRSNQGLVPGDTDKIISNGTSAGGAMSALLGTTGNHPDYEPYLEEMGAAKCSDHIFAASCYCPITNLEYADAAYEWEFSGISDYHRVMFVPPKEPDGKPEFVPVDGEMTKEQMLLSDELKKLFPAYVQSLNMKDGNGNKLTLTDDGGTLVDDICGLVLSAVNKELSAGNSKEIPEAFAKLDWLTFKDGKAVAVNYREYIKFRTRMKETPAFDSLKMDTPENELFGTKEIRYRHFTEFGKAHSLAGDEMAEEQQIRMMNPMNYIGRKEAVCAKYFRVRHGAVDRDTSLFIPAILSLKLKEAGCDVDLAFPWGKWHMGDYDLDELFAWIDGICVKEW